MILQRYLFRQFASAMLYQTIVLSMIIYLIQSLRFFKWITQRQITFIEFAQLSVLLIPQFMTYLIPFAAIFALLYTLVQLKNKQEIMALSVLGVPDAQILKPAFLLILCVVGVQMNLHVIAPKSTQIFQQQEQYFLTRLDVHMIKPGQLQTINNAVIYVDQMHSNSLENIFLYYELPGKKMFITAKIGTLKKHCVHLKQGRYIQVDTKNSSQKTVFFDRLIYNLGPLKSRYVPLAELLQGQKWRCLWQLLTQSNTSACQKEMHCSDGVCAMPNQSELLLRLVKIFLPLLCFGILWFFFRSKKFLWIGIGCCCLNLLLIGLANVLPFSLKVF